MIISKTPFRVSLFGGSTDYKSYYEQHGSLLIGFAMDKVTTLGQSKGKHSTCSNVILLECE